MQYKLIDLIDKLVLREQISKQIASDECGYLRRQNQIFEELCGKLDQHGIELLSQFATAIESKLELVYYNVGEKVLYHGIKYGMDIQKSISS